MIFFPKEGIIFLLQCGGGKMTNIHKVRDLMDTQFTTFRPDTPITEAIDTLIKKSLLGVIVVDDDGTVVADPDM